MKIFKDYSYIWTFIAGFAAITVSMVVDGISIVQVLAAALGVGFLVSTGVLWAEELLNRQYEDLYAELREYIE